jgi:hypothetical protein
MVMITQITEAGEKRLAISLGRSASGRSLSKVSALRGSPGWLVTEDVIKEWKFDGFLSRDGELYLSGLFEPGKGLDAVFPLGLKEGLPYAARLAAALALLSERMVPLFPLQSDSVYFCDDGSVLFFPPDVVRELRGLRTAEDNLDTFELINHPELRGEALASFSIAAVLYRISTGRFPFGGGTVEAMHEEARKLAILPPDKIVPGLSAEFSALVMSGLGKGAGGPVGLAAWKKKTGEWLSEELFKEPSAEEKVRMLQQAAAEKGKSDRRFGRIVFWERNGLRVGVAAVFVVLLGFFIGTVVKNMLAPRVTHGLAPAAVVRTFYLAMNSFDHSTMSSCVTGRTGEEEITEATNIFVFSRVSLGYEGKSNVYGAADWDKAGRPELQPMVGVYGVTDLTVTQEQGEPNPVFTARYVKWTPISQPISSDPKAPFPPGPYFEGKNVTDKIYMKLDREDWVMEKIERLLVEPLTVSK